MKNKIILIGGYAAAGKTTFARRLSQELNVPCYEKDTIDETLCDAFGFESNIVEMGSDAVAFALMLHIAERLLQTEKICILEGSFELEEIGEIKKLLDKYNCECLLFILKGEPGVMFDRYNERDRLGERHWIHMPGFKDWFENIMPVTRGLEEVEIKQKITVDTTSFDKINYDDLFADAKRFITED